MLKRLRAKSGKNQKGFTLIELLAVIVILAILAAIAIPSVVSIISKQNNKAAVQDGLTAIHAAKLYVADHSVTNTQTFSVSDLNTYIDSSVQNKLPSNYSVTYNSTNKTYSIQDQNLPSDGPWGSSNSATEQQLLQYNNGTGSSSGNS